MTRRHVVLRPAGDRAVLVELAGNRSARRLARAAADELAGLEEIVPGHETVLLRWETGRRPPPDLRERIARLLAGADGDADVADAVVFTVRYDGPDLARVAEHCGVSAEELVRRHQAAEYVVGFLGFAPGFAYLLGGDPQLQPPRLETPRTRVPAGAVALAGEYSAVYPAESPGGWNLIGTTDRLPGAVDSNAAFLKSGVRVRFRELPR